VPLPPSANIAAPAPPPRRAPVWEGPESDGPNGGVTQGLLGRWLCCRERARLLLVEGLRPAEAFNHRIFFGNAWHVCEQQLAAAPTTREPGWEVALADCARAEAGKYPVNAEQVDHWYNVVKVTFPLYVAYWAGHPDVTERRPLLQEQVFSVPYRLPSGRTVRLRGKWDAVDLVGRRSPAVYLLETKTKGDVREDLLRRQLARDLQTMTYLTALTQDTGLEAVELPKEKYPIAGVRYNVVRRPLSGGRGSITRHKPSKAKPLGEPKEAFYGRLREIVAADPGYFFLRWTATVTPADLARFRRETLNPILECLCDWWGWVSKFHPQNPGVWGGPATNPGLHWVHPFGVHSPLDEGGATDLDAYLESKSEVGLVRTGELFGELK
jgi:hypothetical protein